MSKIALAMIVAGNNKEAEMLDRCLESLNRAVDAIFITRTHKKGEKPNKKVAEVCEKHGAKCIDFEWVNDFSIARNFSFAQVPEEYDYIMWSDADDAWRSKKDLHKLIEENPADGYSVYYLYAFDEHKQPTVAHTKTMIVKNDGSFEWKGSIHEDLMTDRSDYKIVFLKDVERLHLTDDEKIEEARHRNLEIALADHKKNPDDPRTLWNVGNSQLALGQYKECLKTFDMFIRDSGSQDEIYVALMRQATAYDALGEPDKSKEKLQIAIGKQYDYPDAYFQLGYLMFNQGEYNEAERVLLNGLALKPQTHRMVAFNPRDYDYNPLRVLAKIYIQINKPAKALTCIESCLKILPGNEELKSIRKIIRSELRKFKAVDEYAERYVKAKTKKAKEKIFNEIPKKFKDHPKVCTMRNELFVKKESSGKDLVFYCGQSFKPWSSRTLKTEGMGGSEESVVHLATQFAKKGWNVTVYNNCGPRSFTHNKVRWEPFWKFNVRDKQDVLIGWRSATLADFRPNCDKLIIDLHDVISPKEFTKARLEKIDKIFVKTEFHRSLFPDIPDEKIAVVPNGQAFHKAVEKKDQYLMINTSSPDRSLSVIPELFREIKKQVPKAKMKWAYGFDIFDVAYGTDKDKQEWKEGVIRDCEDAGIEMLGRITQEEVGKLYEQANILLYPSEFAEIDCISVKKAQGSGCVPITTDFGAFAESVQHGVKIKSRKNRSNWAPPGKFDFAITSDSMKQEFIDEAVKFLKTPVDDRKEMREWAKKFDWSLIADRYLENI